jgi:hypothetical protein
MCFFVRDIWAGTSHSIGVSRCRVHNIIGFFQWKGKGITEHERKRLQDELLLCKWLHQANY